MPITLGLVSTDYRLNEQLVVHIAGPEELSNVEYINLALRKIQSWRYNCDRLCVPLKSNF